MWLWRSLKYEEVYLHAYETVKQANNKIGRWLDRTTPDQVCYDLPSNLPRAA